jgi:hypothetical protein
MLRRLLPLVLVSLVAAPLALADGGGAPVAAQGVVAPGGKIRYATLANGRSTTVNASHLNGVVVRWRDVRGHWAVPGVTLDGTPGGLSGDGRTLVLIQPQTTVPFPKRSAFLVVRTSDLEPVQRVVLKGNFAFDALSPDGARLYLIQRVSKQNLSRYVVRAYALDERRLVSGAIADKAQRGWVMAGYPVRRVTSADGRWVYTFYVRSGAYSFVHALDATRGVAHCIGIPWNGDQNRLWQLGLSLRDGGRTLSVNWPSGREYLAITRGTWRISHPSAATARAAGGSGFPWWVVGAAGAGALLLLAAGRMRYGLRARAATN